MTKLHSAIAVLVGSITVVGVLLASSPASAHLGFDPASVQAGTRAPLPPIAAIRVVGAPPPTPTPSTGLTTTSLAATPTTSATTTTRGTLEIREREETKTESVRPPSPIRTLLVVVLATAVILAIGGGLAWLLNDRR